MTLKILNLQLIQELKECSFVENPTMEARLILSWLLKKSLSSFLLMSQEMCIDCEVEKAAVAAVNGNAYDVMSLASVISSFIFAKVAINFITLQG